jgi:hypothetical protein
MAQSRPPEPRWTPDAAPAERSLWQWAVEQLPDDVLVLPQVAMTVGGGGRTEEAEADLVIIDPAFGLTIVEVKGGEVWYDGHQARWRRKAKELERDPVTQVKRTRSVLRTALAHAGIDVETVALRWAVAVPDTRLLAPGEPVLDAAQLWDGGTREHLEQAYRRTCGALVLGEQPPGPDLAEHLAGILRGRTREGRIAMATLVERQEESIRVHTESHRNVLHHFAARPHVLVRGAAGTGKTVLAIQAAAQFAALGQRVLLAGWNIMLSHALRAGLRTELERMGSPRAAEVTDDPTGGIVAAHLVHLARAGLTEQPDDVADEELYQRVLPDALVPDVTGGEFDVIVLDEAQDLADPWVLAVGGLLKPEGRWYAFSDRQQDLFQKRSSLPDFLEVEHELRENFRNSRAIAEFAAEFGDVELDCVSEEGPPVRYIPLPAEQVLAGAETVARGQIKMEKFAEADVAVLWLFHNPYKGRNDVLAREAAAGRLVRTNSASFKGMERPVVVLGLEMDPAKSDRRDEVQRAIYTAATRARSHLIVVGDPDVARAYGFDALAARLEAI